MKKIFVILLFPSLALAWGGRGHDAICVAASFLVKDKNLAEFLKYRSHVMGHLCNIPDTYWKGLPAEITKVGNPTHFIDPEVTGLKVSEIPNDYATVVKEFTGKDNKIKPNAKIFSVPDDVGSVWWRADQFMRRIAQLDFKEATPPEKKQEQDDKLPYNANVYQMWVNMGLMGHFVGDAAQPFHSSADYDGYMHGHGGIHSYYEEQVVAQIGQELPDLIVKKAKILKSPSFLKPKNTVEKMKELSVLSNKDIEKIFKLDPVIKKSEVIKDKGMEIRTAAERKSPEAGLKVFKPMIIEEMARSATLLANLWDAAYASVGRPDLSKYRSYKYPFTPDFVPPDYIPALATEKATK
jgi:hypothetical protein